MPRPVASAQPLKPGPALPKDWQARFLQAYRTKGGIWRAAETAGVHPRTVERYRHADPDFDAAVVDAREYFADLTAERMLELGERSDNPVPHIVTLKALRPHEYIEKHAVLSVSVSTTLDASDGRAFLQGLIHDMSPQTHALIGGETGSALRSLTRSTEGPETA